MKTLLISIFLILAVAGAAHAAKPAGSCEDSLGYIPPAPLEISAAEHELFKDLENFFHATPRAENMVRTAFYGMMRDQTNKTLVTALQNLPAANRTELVHGIVTEVLKKEYSSHSDFARLLIEASLARNKGPELFRLPNYFSYDLLKILSAAKDQNFRVLTFSGGRGEFAMVESADRAHAHYYRIDDNTMRAWPISKVEFKSVFEWRKRSAKGAEVKGGALAGWLARFRRFSAAPEKEDAVQFYSKLLVEDKRLIWIYTMNALSNESYALVTHLLNNGVNDLARFLDHAETHGGDVSFGRFLKALWEFAAKASYELKLDQEVYAESELFEIMRAFKIGGFISDSHSSGYRIFKYKNEEMYFVKGYQDDGQLVYRKHSKESFLQYKSKEESKIDELFQPYEGVKAITKNVDLENFPEHITPLTDQQESLLDIALNPGHASMGGFKQKNEKLRRLIESDGQTVIQRGYTHQELAQWLQDKIKRSQNGEDRILLNGRSIEISPMGYLGAQLSPFGDEFGWAKDYTLIDLQTGKRIRFSGGHPYMIGYYGFFEGNVAQRLPPAELIDFIEGN